MPSKPLVSIITINRNNAVGLHRTLESAATQTFRSFEHLVIDGASNDGSQSTAKKFEEQLAFFRSEPDTGIYNAMNKGIAKARGDYLLFLNSGDTLKGRFALETAAKQLGKEQLVYFDLDLIDSAGRRRQSFPERLDFAFFVRQSLPHPSTFIDPDLFRQSGPYDESLKIVSDWKAFMVWVCRYNCTYKYVPEVLTEFPFDGLSSRPESAPIWQAERERVIRCEFPAIYDTYLEGCAALQTLKNLRNNTVLRRLQTARMLRSF